MKFTRILASALAVLFATCPFWAGPFVFGQSAVPGLPGGGAPGSASQVPGQSSASFWQADHLQIEEAAANRDVAKLLNEYSKAEGDAQRAKIKAKLTSTLENEFDIQQKRRDLELVTLGARIKKVRELMQRRSAERQTIIEKRADQLLREADGLGWAPPQGIKGQQSAPYNYRVGAETFYTPMPVPAANGLQGR